VAESLVGMIRLRQWTTLQQKGAGVKFLPLVWAGVWRKPGRSLLILAQVIIAFTLFGVLQGMNGAIKQSVALSHADRFYVGSRLRFGEPLPISMVARLQSTAGVVGTAYRFIFGGSYQRPAQYVPVAATDVDSYLAMYPELHASPADVRQQMQRTQDGTIVGGDVLRRYGWQVGQRITLQAPLPRKNGSRDWSFQILGTYENTDSPDESIMIMANYRYINESLAGQADTISFAVVRVADPRHASEVGEAIDRQFANSANETLTQSEQELAQAQVENIGDLDVVVRRITGATFFVLLFATGALMMQSIRERTPEFAVLKTVGFSDLLVMVLILLETLVLCVAGAVLGLWIASRILPLARAYIGIGSLPAVVVLDGLICAVVLALAGGAIPALRGMRLRVVDALANR
jgi:putative ABC transport system permease protein